MEATVKVVWGGGNGGDGSASEGFPPLSGSPKVGEGLAPSPYVGPVGGGESTPWSSRFFGPSVGVDASGMKLHFIAPCNDGEKVYSKCGSDEVKGEVAKLDLSLVGFFLGKRPGYSFVRSTLKRLWKCQGQVEVIALHNGAFLFKFSEAADRARVLEKGLFVVARKPMFVRQWERSLSLESLGLESLPLWVSLPGLPLHLWGSEALSSIGSSLGKPLYSDKRTMTKERLAFARMCVDFSAGSGLPDFITIEDDDGNRFSQRVIYDWKPEECCVCKLFGHPSTACKPNEEVSEEHRINATIWRKKEHPLASRKTAVSEENGVSVPPANDGLAPAGNVDEMGGCQLPEGEPSLMVDPSTQAGPAGVGDCLDHDVVDHLHPCLLPGKVRVLGQEESESTSISGNVCTANRFALLQEGDEDNAFNGSELPLALVQTATSLDIDLSSSCCTARIAESSPSGSLFEESSIDAANLQLMDVEPSHLHS